MIRGQSVESLWVINSLGGIREDTNQWMTRSPIADDKQITIDYYTAQ